MDFDNLTKLETHTEKNEYKCNNCDKLFSNNTILLKHMEMHNTEKDFKCSICGNDCQNETSLNTHMDIHTLDKPFQSIRGSSGAV